MTVEARLHRRLREAAATHGAYGITLTVPPNDVGSPDRVLCHRGQFIAFEVKPPGQHPSCIQLRRLAQITQAGGIAAWGADRELHAALARAEARHHHPFSPAALAVNIISPETP
jgi:hypothetical protein